MPVQKTNVRKATRPAKAIKQTSFKPYRPVSRKAIFIGIGIFAALAVIFMWRSFAATSTPGFVYRNGKDLMLNGAPYKFVGFNAFGMTGCEGAAWTRAQLDAYFKQLPPVSVTRFWAFRPYGTATIDQIIASAEAHNQKVAPVLGNDLSDCDSEGAKSAGWYQTGYKTSYLPWAQSMATRYKNSPAVAYWEIINEAGQAQGEGSLNGTTVMNFYNTVGTAIKKNDPNHLVSTGDNAEFNYASGISGYKVAATAPSVDILSLHDYEYDYVSSPPIVSSHFTPTKMVANDVNKPIVIGETNLSACKGVTTSSRASLMKSRIDAYLAQGASGVLIWNRSQQLYGTECKGENYIIAGSDPIIALIQNYTIPGVVATPPTKPIPSSPPAPTPKPVPGPTSNPAPGPSSTPPTESTPAPSPSGDTHAPTAPPNLRASFITRSSVTLRWDASTDNVGVSCYLVYRSGQKIANQSGRSLRVNGLRSHTTYIFMVKACDAAGNVSAGSSIKVTTLGSWSWWHWFWWWR